MKRKLKILLMAVILILGVGIITEFRINLFGIQVVQANENVDDESEIPMTESCWKNGEYISCSIIGCLTGDIDCEPSAGCCD